MTALATARKGREHLGTEESLFVGPMAEWPVTSLSRRIMKKVAESQRL